MPPIVSHGRRASSSSLRLLPHWPDHRRSASRICADQALLPGIAVTRPSDDGAPVSTEVGVVRFGCVPAASSRMRAWWSALKSFGCMHACAGPARGFVSGKVRRARHRSSGSRRRGSTAGQFRAATGARWRAALSSQRHDAGPRPSCVGTRPSG